MPSFTFYARLAVFGFALTIASFSTGCGAVPFDPAQRVERTDSLLREHAYRQNGHFVDTYDLRQKLQLIPACHDSAASSGRWKAAGYFSAGATLTLAVTSLTTSGSTQTILLLSALPTLGFEFLAFAISDRQLMDSVQQFEEYLDQKNLSPNRATIVPYFALTPAGQTSAGLTMKF